MLDTEQGDIKGKRLSLYEGSRITVVRGERL
jgi:hypothetical protein